MVDLILIRDRWRSAVDNTRSFQSVDIESDHSLVLAKIRVKFKVEKKGLRRKKWNITKLDDPSIAKDFQQELQNGFQLEDEVDTYDPIADYLLEQTTTIIKKQQMRSLGFMGQRRNLGFRMQLLHWQIKKGRLGRRLFKTQVFAMSRGKLGNGEHLSLDAYKCKKYNIYVLIIMQHKEHIKFYPEIHFYWHNFSR